MSIDPDVAIGAELPGRQLIWKASDVLLYHLAIGAGPEELRYVYERDLIALPTFAVVAHTLRETAPPVLSMPGIEVDLVDALHGRQELVLHRPLPVEATTHETARIADVYDKGSAAVIVTESACDYFTLRTTIFVKGAGGFGGARGPSTRVPLPAREPDATVLSTTRPEQALLYRLCGDLNPLHVDPAFAARAGFPRPILHGLCTYGIVAKAVVDTVLDGDPGRLASYSARFAGVVYPGETLRTDIWHEDGRYLVAASIVERPVAVALSDAVVTVH